MPEKHFEFEVINAIDHPDGASVQTGHSYPYVVKNGRIVVLERDFGAFSDNMPGNGLRYVGQNNRLKDTTPAGFREAMEPSESPAPVVEDKLVEQAQESERVAVINEPSTEIPPSIMTRPRVLPARPVQE